MKLLLKYFSMHLKTSLEYKLSFVLSVFSQLVYMLIELFTVGSLFQKFSLLDEFNIFELILSFSIIWTGFSLAELFGRGFDNFSKLIVNGNFDILLIRPRSIYLQIIGTDVCYEKIGRIILGIALIIYSSCNLVDVFSIDKIILVILMVLGSMLLILGLLIIGATFAFYTIQGLEAVNVITNGTKQVSEYPLNIYNKAIKKVFTYIIPTACINYYPILYLTGKSDNILYMFLPLVSILFILISLFIFKIGIRHYASTGS